MSRDSHFSRRRVMFAGGAADALAAQSGGPRNIAIAGANGTICYQRAMQIVRAGGDTMDAAVAGVTLVQDDPNDDSVGFGGLPNEEGVVELDASVMHGPTRRAGAVAGVRNIKNVAKLAKDVMEQTKHIMLVGEGSARFAKAWGFPEENLLTEKSRMAWMVWKQALRDASGGSNWTGSDPAAAPKAKVAEQRKLFPSANEELLAYAWNRAVNPPTGAINCLVLNAKGDMSGATTTSGLAWRIPGRIGDSPSLAPASTWTRTLEALAPRASPKRISASAARMPLWKDMRRSMPPTDACLDVLNRISRDYHNDQARMKFNISFYALRKDGAYGCATLFGQAGKPAKFAVHDGSTPESRLEEGALLYSR